MKSIQFSQRFILAVCIVLMIGCESAQTKKSAPARDTDGLRNIVPTAEKDRGPSKAVDVSQVSNAVPKVEPRTAAGNKSPYKVKGIVYRVMDDPNGYKAYGTASWYGEKFHGNRTSNGEIYDMYGMSGAHKSLPIPSYVKVTNVVNGKHIIVRINDRGPFAHGRIIDLSYAGAQKLGYAHAGTAKVKVEYIDPLSPRWAALVKPSAKKAPSLTGAKPVSAHSSNASDVVVTSTVSASSEAINSSSSALSPSGPERFLQVGAFADESAALTMQFQVASHTEWRVSVEQGHSVNRAPIHRVYVGPLPDEATLQAVKTELQHKGMAEPLRVVK